MLNQDGRDRGWDGQMEVVEDEWMMRERIGWWERGWDDREQVNE